MFEIDNVIVKIISSIFNICLLLPFYMINNFFPVKNIENSIIYICKNFIYQVFLQLNGLCLLNLIKPLTPLKKLYDIIFLHQILMNIFNIIHCNRIIINTKIINITSKSNFFILFIDQSFEVFPRHIGPTKI